MSGTGAPPFADDSVTRPQNPAGALTDLEDAKIFNAVAGSIVRDLKLGLPGVSVEVVDRPTFVQLLANWGQRQELAWEARRAAAVALGSRIVVQADALAAMTATDRAMLYAHELAHIAQAHLQYGGGRAKTWLLEGHAEWVSYRVVDRLGYRPYVTSREIVQRRVGRASGPRERWPSLTDLETTEAWLRTAARLGWHATYGQAFLATDRLVDRYGESKLHQLFQRFSAPEARRGTIDGGGLFGDSLGERYWSELFAVPYHDFVAEFRADVEMLR